jgi:hypothetical protein
MVEGTEKEQFCASVYWDGNGYRLDWAVRVGQREQSSGNLMSLHEDGARYHARCEAARRGFDAIRWEDGSAG